MARSKEASSNCSSIHSVLVALGRNSDWRCPGRFGTGPLDLVPTLD